MIDLTNPDHLYDLARSATGHNRQELALAMHDVMDEHKHPIAADILLLLLKEAEHDLRLLLANKLATQRECPMELIQFLVYETPLSVSEPVIKQSPLLNDTELSKILDHFTQDLGYVQAVAQRQTISAQIAAKILEQGDENAQLLLLKNKGAELNEICLDYLVDLAKKRPALQQPFLQRREITAAVATKLYWFVSIELRQHILNHFPMDAGRLDQVVEKSIKEKIELKEGLFYLTDEVKVKAERMNNTGALNTRQVMEALRKGDVPLFVCLIALMTHTRPEKILELLINDTTNTLAVIAHVMRLNRVDFNGLYLLWRRQAQPHTVLHEHDISHAQTTFGAVNAEKAQTAMQNWQSDKAD
jgi:uncharacterized protein (DUF2336 family)